MDKPASPVQFWLEVQPEAPGQPWRAILQQGQPEPEVLAQPLEFESPMELARHLADLGSNRPKGRLR